MDGPRTHITWAICSVKKIPIGKRGIRSCKERRVLLHVSWGRDRHAEEEKDRRENGRDNRRVNFDHIDRCGDKGSAAAVASSGISEGFLCWRGNWFNRSLADGPRGKTRIRGGRGGEGIAILLLSFFLSFSLSHSSFSPFKLFSPGGWRGCLYVLRAQHNRAIAVKNWSMVHEACRYKVRNILTPRKIRLTGKKQNQCWRLRIWESWGFAFIKLELRSDIASLFAGFALTAIGRCYVLRHYSVFG